MLLLLFFFLFGLRTETLAPFWASAAIIVISQLRKSTRLSKEQLIGIISKSGKVLLEMVCLLAAVGLICGALSITGVALSFSRELVNAVGNNLYLLLLAGAFTSFLLGFGMTSTACYIFLAIVMVPALLAMEVPAMAAHFFVLYWGIVAYITPPVALATFAASKISGSSPFETGFLSMKLGVVTYFVPFMFVFDPRLVAIGTLSGILYAVFKTAIAVIMIGCALEGYLIGIEVKTNVLLRALLIIIGVFIGLPIAISDVIGLSAAAVLMVVLLALKKAGKLGEVYSEEPKSVANV